ncbi:hypothetical protein AB0A69_33500 [Streptomyces sp. NPDC045431]|uniref:hypothetical protein n=1 Tax=Streptomyces sp. NPDC045431 TaxID=3155613 RepID=UPI0033F3B06B
MLKIPRTGDRDGPGRRGRNCSDCFGSVPLVLPVVMSVFAGLIALTNAVMPQTSAHRLQLWQLLLARRDATRDRRAERRRANDPQ